MKVEFNEPLHRYTCNGKTLHGVTGAISALLGKRFPVTQKDTVNNFTIATDFGVQVHKEVENYYNTGKETTLKASKWVVSTLSDFCTKNNIVQNIQSEVMISDFVATASKIDVVVMSKDGAFLFDIKTTSTIDRQYCSLQLSVYKKLFEKNYGCKVLGLFVLGTKSQRLYRMQESTEYMINAVLEYNKKLYVKGLL